MPSSPPPILRLLALVAVASAVTSCRGGGRDASAGADADWDFGDDGYRGTRTWTVGGHRFWIDVPVAMSPASSAGAMSLSTDGTADRLFLDVEGARSVRVNVGVALHSETGARSRLLPLRFVWPGGGFVPSPSAAEDTRRTDVPGSPEAYVGTGGAVKPGDPAEKRVRLVLHAAPPDGDRYWSTTATATGPQDHPLLERDGPLIRLLERCVRSFSLVERPVARLPVRKPGRGDAVAAARRTMLDAVDARATGAESPRAALRLTLEAAVAGDAAAWSRVVVYGRNSEFAKTFDDNQLATMRLARAVRRRPVPGIGSWYASRAASSLKELEDALHNVDRLPLPPREGERVDEGATGGPRRLVERGGRFFIERYGPDDGDGGAPDDPGLNPFIRSFRASAVAHAEAAAAHLAGWFGDVKELEAFIDRRRRGLMPPEPQEPSE